MDEWMDTSGCISIFYPVFMSHVVLLIYLTYSTQMGDKRKNYICNVSVRCCSTMSQQKSFNSPCQRSLWKSTAGMRHHSYKGNPVIWCLNDGSGSMACFLTRLFSLCFDLSLVCRPVCTSKELNTFLLPLDGTTWNENQGCLVADLGKFWLVVSNNECNISS